MSDRHKVEPGDWLGSIAAKYGFSHWSQIWDDPANMCIRELRGCPDLVLVGDEVALPGAGSSRGVEVAAGQRVVFVARPKDVLRLKVSGVGRLIEAFGPLEFVFEAGTQSRSGVLEHDNEELTLPLELGVRTAKLTLMGKDTYTFFVGGLGPVDEQQGAQARLANLGFRGDVASGAGAESHECEQNVDAWVQAVSMFQGRHGLQRTGCLDDATRTKLKSEYGG